MVRGGGAISLQFREDVQNMRMLELSIFFIHALCVFSYGAVGQIQETMYNEEVNSKITDYIKISRCYENNKSKAWTAGKAP